MGATALAAVISLTVARGCATAVDFNIARRDSSIGAPGLAANCAACAANAIGGGGGAVWAITALWPYAAGYAEGRRRDELLLAIGYLIAAFEDHTLDTTGVLLNRGAITARMCRLRDELVGPTPGDPGRSTRSSAVDALAFTGACYALPVYARELGRHQVPLLWPWPRGLYRQHERGLELLLAAAMLLAEIERQDRATGTVTAGLTAVAGGAQ